MDPDDFADQIAEHDSFPDELDNEQDQFMSDTEADADALASAGWGCDEDYGLYESDMDG